jgi:putative ABC transport system substrate-binding protein
MHAARAASASVPIVFSMGGDPVKLGIVKSLNRPDGNLTGVTAMSVEVGPKRVELLHELLPKATTFAALVNPTNPGATIQSNELMRAAATRGLKLHILHAATDRDIDDAFAALVGLRAEGFVVGSNALFSTHAGKIAALSVRHAVPTIFQNRPFVEAGGLVSYGGSSADMFRQIGVYAGRIVKGARPADLPVQQAAKVEMIINLKTAKTLGITVPLPLIGRADEVIE